MKEIFKKNQAITLVSLVVTIIILIILAGVSINLILGKNGIITIAKQAKENTELAKIEEETALNELYMQIEAEGGSTGDISYDAIAKLVEFKREIASAISDMGITTSEDADASTMASNIRSISEASSADKVSYDNTNSGLTATNVQGAVDEVNNSLGSLNDYIQSCINNGYLPNPNIILVFDNGNFYKPMNYQTLNANGNIYYQTTSKTLTNIRTTDSIDVTGYNKLKITINSASINGNDAAYIKVGYSTDGNTFESSLNVITGTGSVSNQTYEINLSTVNGKNIYPMISCNNNYNVSSTLSITISKISIE